MSKPNDNLDTSGGPGQAGYTSGPSCELRTKDLTENDWLQIEQASAGCIGGTSDDWPMLRQAIEKITGKPFGMRRCASWLQGFCEGVIIHVGRTVEAAKAKAAKAAEIEHRKEARICVCCGDDRDIKRSGHCGQCWRELTYGTIEPPTVSERQVQSAACRVVRKGTEMS